MKTHHLRDWWCGFALKADHKINHQQPDAVCRVDDPRPPPPQTVLSCSCSSRFAERKRSKPPAWTRASARGKLSEMSLALSLQPASELTSSIRHESKSSRFVLKSGASSVQQQQQQHRWSLGLGTFPPCPFLKTRLYKLQYKYWSLSVVMSD